MDPNSPEFRNALLELRARAMPETPEVEARVKNALDPKYWRGLNSRMTVCGSEPCEDTENIGLDPSCLERALQTVSTSGYYELPRLVTGPAVDKLRNCLELTQGVGWHPVFVFVYDEFWRAFRGPALNRFLTGALGESYAQLPYIWGHYVPANSRGWRPHVDGPTTVDKLTVWLALTDATLENGCMYVVPRNSETEEMSDQFLSRASFDSKDTRTFLQHAKALPAAAGTYLGWGPFVVHWGSTSGPLATARISISVEFARRPADSLAGKGPLMNASPDALLPPFSARLHFIAKALKNYEGFEPHVMRCLPVAKQILRQTTVEGAC
jgi:Phytanoyl-CoA dioxygenase (PhyH)